MSNQIEQSEAVEKAETEELPKKSAKHKHAPAVISRKQLVALWATAMVALGTNGVPKIVETLSSKPSVEKVQELIATQTDEITESHNKLVSSVEKLASDVARMQGTVEVLLNMVKSARSALAKQESQPVPEVPTLDRVPEIKLSALPVE